MTILTTYRTIAAIRVSWARENLFNSRFDTLLSLTAIVAGSILAFLIVRFVLFQANWGLVAINRRLFFVGSYPSDEMYRIWISLFLVGMLVTLTYGLWVGEAPAVPSGVGCGGRDNADTGPGDGVPHRGAGV